MPGDDLFKLVVRYRNKCQMRTDLAFSQILLHYVMVYPHCALTFTG